MWADVRVRCPLHSVFHHSQSSELLFSMYFPLSRRSFSSSLHPSSFSLSSRLLFLLPRTNFLIEPDRIAASPSLLSFLSRSAREGPQRNAPPTHKTVLRLKTTSRDQRKSSWLRDHAHAPSSSHRRPSNTHAPRRRPNPIAQTQATTRQDNTPRVSLSNLTHPARQEPSERDQLHTFSNERDALPESLFVRLLLPGTDISVGAICLCECYAMSGTDSVRTSLALCPTLTSPFGSLSRHRTRDQHPTELPAILGARIASARALTPQNQETAFSVQVEVKETALSVQIEPGLRFLVFGSGVRSVGGCGGCGARRKSI